MTDKTNQCSEHSGLAGCAANLKKEIDDKMWPAIRKVSDKVDGMVPRWIRGLQNLNPKDICNDYDGTNRARNANPCSLHVRRNGSLSSAQGQIHNA